jgi:hypothetical protein
MNCIGSGGFGIGTTSTAAAATGATITASDWTLDNWGGTLLACPKDGPIYVTIIEKAQAEIAGQLELFEKLGLRRGDNKAFFNTNMALFNYQLLVPKINKLVKKK